MSAFQLADWTKIDCSTSTLFSETSPQPLHRRHTLFLLAIYRALNCACHTAEILFRGIVEEYLLSFLHGKDATRR